MSSEEQEYEFEYESDADESDGDVDIENEYYNAKGKKDDDKEEALTGFIAVIGMQEDKDEWGFKALKQMVKILFEMGRFDDMMVRYKEMLTYIKSAVTRNMVSRESPLGRREGRGAAGWEAGEEQSGRGTISGVVDWGGGGRAHRSIPPPARLEWIVCPAARHGRQREHGGDSSHGHEGGPTHGQTADS